PPRLPTPFPYTTLFRSRGPHDCGTESQRNQHGVLQTRHREPLDPAGPTIAVGIVDGGFVGLGSRLRRRRTHTSSLRCERNHVSTDRKSTRLNSSHASVS